MRLVVLLVGLLLASAAAVPAQPTGVREVTASSRTLISLTTKLRYTTMVVLPEADEILDVVCGDRDFWVIAATHNIAHIKPAKEGAATNLHLVTARGVFSFVLTESKAGPTDVKVFVTPDPEQPRERPSFASLAQVETLEGELASVRAARDAEQRRADEQVVAFKAQYPATLQFVYGAPKYEKPFFVRAVWHDGRFTYLRSDARELPALYEWTDGQPALVEFQVQHGLYVVPKVIERGYLALGKQRWTFRQER